MSSSSPEEEERGHVRRVGEPSFSRQRSGEGVWPEPFVEAVAIRVATDAAREAGRIAAARAVAVLFQVCSTWRQVCHSELLWQTLTHQIWLAEVRRLPTWREEYGNRHHTACNFRTGNYVHTPIFIHDSADSMLVCHRLALSDRHLVAGYVDGSVRLFELPSARPLATYGPHPGRDFLGPFSQSISGLLLDERSSRLVFASQDGNIQVASTRDPDLGSRRARVGNLVEDGALVDFTGRGQLWVGLFAGVPGRSLQVWDGVSEEVLYLGGNLTDPESVMGWHTLTELSGLVGRVRVADRKGDTLVGCTASTIQTVNLEREDVGVVLEEQELPRVAMVESVDAWEERVIVVDSRGVAKVLHARTLEEVCRFSAGGGGGARALSLSGGLNWGYVVVYCAGRIRVWDAMTGDYLFAVTERIGGDRAGVVAVSDRHVAAWSAGTGLHLWDFGAF